jgi:hypothetical protein
MQVVNGTSYHDRTDPKVIEVLEAVRKNKTRIRLILGDTETGRPWGETLGVTGTISRSQGPMKVPIMICNARSLGGAQLLDHCILGIRTSVKRDGTWFYKHPQYKGDE